MTSSPIPDRAPLVRIQQEHGATHLPARRNGIQGQHDVKPWLDYFWGALPRAYREFEERVGALERGRGSKGNRVRAEILGRSLPFSISEIEEACPGVSRDMVQLVLRAMKSEELDAFNGFLLVANLDALFDRFMISFDDIGNLLTSTRLSQSDLHGLGVHPGRTLHWLASEHRPYLQWHRARFLLGA